MEYLSVVLHTTNVADGRQYGWLNLFKGKVVPMLNQATKHHAMKAYWGVEV